LLFAWQRRRKGWKKNTFQVSSNYEERTTSLNRFAFLHFVPVEFFACNFPHPRTQPLHCRICIDRRVNEKAGAAHFQLWRLQKGTSAKAAEAAQGGLSARKTYKLKAPLLTEYFAGYSTFL
jgi:hypothetical protein